MGKYNLGFIDFDSEKSSAGVDIINLTGANFAAQAALLATLRTAIEAVVLGTTVSEQVIATATVFAGGPPIDPFAQRETKWLVSGTDGNGFRSTLEIPTANLALLQPGTGLMNLTAGAGLALKGALDAVWLSPRSATAIVVDTVLHVGRNI